MKHRPSYTTRYRQRGISLVELMIAILLGLILMAGVLQLFSSNKSTFHNMEGISEIQDGGRAGIERLKSRIRMAGFMGCSNVNRLQAKNKSTGATAIAFNPNVVIRGTDNEASAGLVAGTDTLTVISGTSADSEMDANMTSVTSDVTITTNPNNFAVNDNIIITDCENADIFSVENITSAVPGTGPYTIEHAGATNGNDGTLSKSYLKDDSMIMSLQGVTYSVRPTTPLRTDGDGNPVLALFETRGAATTELISGVEDMQISYGVDNGTDAEADVYVTAAGIPTAGGGTWSDVVSVRISLLISTERGVGPNIRPYTNLAGVAVPNGGNPGDNHMRRAFNTTVGLRNRSF